MTRAAALADVAAATDAGFVLEIWEHVGGRLPGGKVVLPQARFITRESDKPAPKHVWRKVEPISLAPTAVVARATPEAVADGIIDLTRDWFTKEDAPTAFGVMRDAIVDAIRSERENP